MKERDDLVCQDEFKFEDARASHMSDMIFGAVKKGLVINKFVIHEVDADIIGAWFNPPYTTVKWADYSTTTVKCDEEDEYDREKGFLLCCAKKLFGGGHYNDVMREFVTPHE